MPCEAQQDCVVSVAGETLRLLPDAAAFWVETRTLLIADVHLGKAATFRSLAVPVPGGTTGKTVDRLDALMEKVRPERVIFLGDLWHAKAGRTDAIVEAFLRWRRGHSAVEMILVEGNHDRKAGKLPAELEIQEVTQPLVFERLALAHDPEPIEGKYVIAGHIHPAARLEGRGGQEMTLPCFWFGEHVGVLPAFGEFTGRALVRPRNGDRVFGIADGRVHPLRAPTED